MFNDCSTALSSVPVTSTMMFVVSSLSLVNSPLMIGCIDNTCSSLSIMRGYFLPGRLRLSFSRNRERLSPQLPASRVPAQHTPRPARPPSSNAGGHLQHAPRPPSNAEALKNPSLKSRRREVARRARDVLKENTPKVIDPMFPLLGPLVTPLFSFRSAPQSAGKRGAPSPSLRRPPRTRATQNPTPGNPQSWKAPHLSLWLHR